MQSSGIYRVCRQSLSHVHLVEASPNRRTRTGHKFESKLISKINNFLKNRKIQNFRAPISTSVRENNALVRSGQRKRTLFTPGASLDDEKDGQDQKMMNEKVVCDADVTILIQQKTSFFLNHFGHY